MDYNIFDLGFSKQLLKTSYLTPLIQNDMEVSSYLKSDFFNATNPTNISSGNTVGNLIVTDGYLKSSNYLAGVSGWQLTPTSADLNISLSVDEIHIPDESTENSFHTDEDGNSWWGAIAIEDATASILNTGEGAFSNITITGGSVAASILDGTIGLGNLDLANRGWVQTCIFGVTDADTVDWEAGTFTSADGTAYNISSGNTGTMTAKTYIYLDVNVSETAYQITTTATTAVGAGKVLVAIAENGTGEATYQVINGQGGVNIDASSIVAGSITGNEIAASTITAGKISITSLSSISANLGTVTIDSAGYLRAGATGYMTGNGIWMGYDTDAYKFRVGTTTEYIAFDGSVFDITVPINTPHYFTMYMPWKVSNSTPTSIPYDLNKLWEIKCVCSKVTNKPTYVWVGIRGDNTSGGYSATYIRILKYKRNNSGEYDYTGVYWEKGFGAGDAPIFYSICQYGDDYIYVVYSISGVYKMYRLNVSDLGGETAVTGLNSSYPYISTNNTKLYFYNNSTTVKVFTVTNATTITDDSTDITLSSNPGTRHYLCDGTYFYFTGITNIKKYVVSSGNLSATSDIYNVPDNAVASTPSNRILAQIPGSTISDNGAFWSQGILHRVLQQIICNALITGPSATVYVNDTVDTRSYLEVIPCPKI